MSFNSLADFLARTAGAGASPAIWGMAEADSDGGEVDIYVGEMEQVYETAMQPVYETDDEGNLIYDDEGDPIPVEDDEGNVIYEEQTVYDVNGDPVPVLGPDGEPVFRKVQLTDPDGEPILSYDPDGNPIAQTDEHGEPIYREDDEGNPLPVLDDNGDQVYTYGDDGEPIPLYQVEPVVETQIVTVPAVGSVKAGETPVVSMGFGGAAAIASAGWGDAVEAAIDAAQNAADEAAQVANATGQHFWPGDDGIHVTEVTKEAWEQSAAGHNILINSLGLLLRTALSNLVSITRSAVAFFDGLGNDPANVVAQFGKDGARVGKVGEPHVDITAGDMAFYDGRGLLSRNVVTRMGATGAKIGRETDMHVAVSDAGFSVENGPDNWLAVSGTPIGNPAVWNDGESDYEVHALEYELDGFQFNGDMAPYRVYGVFDGSNLSASVYEALQAGTLDEHVHIDPDGMTVYVVPPVGEPEPEMWFVSDGEVADMLVSVGEGELFPNRYIADASPAWDAGKHRPALAHGLWEEYGIDGTEQPGDFGREFLSDSPNSFVEDFEANARTYLGAVGYGTIVIASAYRRRAGEFNATVPLKQDGVQVSVEGHTHVVSDIEGDIVTGVKGSAEDEYRTGDVDIGEEDLGLEVLSNQEISVLFANA